jgi:hypothetical protein
VSVIEFGDDGVNAIPQFDQLPKRALLVGDHLVNASLKIFLAQRARAGCLFIHAAKVSGDFFGFEGQIKPRRNSSGNLATLAAKRDASSLKARTVASLAVIFASHWPINADGG